MRLACHRRMRQPVADIGCVEPLLLHIAQNPNFVVVAHALAIAVDAERICEACGRALRGEKHALTASLQRTHRVGGLEIAVTDEAYTGDFHAVHLDDQRGRGRSGNDRESAQPDMMIAEFDADTIGVDLTEDGPSKDEPAVPTRAGD